LRQLVMHTLFQNSTFGTFLHESKSGIFDLKEQFLG